jgi:hypothetical protein
MNNTCYPIEQVQTMFNYIDMHVVCLDYFIDTKDYINPIKPTFFSSINIGSVKGSRTDEYVFKNTEVRTDEGWIMESIDTKYTNQYERSGSTFVNWSPGDPIHFDIFTVDSLRDINHRKYLKLQDVLATSGGFLKICLLFFSFLNDYFQSHNLIENMYLQIIEKYCKRVNQSLGDNENLNSQNNLQHNNYKFSNFKLSQYKDIPKNCNKESAVNIINYNNKHNINNSLTLKENKRINDTPDKAIVDCELNNISDINNVLKKNNRIFNNPLLKLKQSYQKLYLCQLMFPWVYKNKSINILKKISKRIKKLLSIESIVLKNQIIKTERKALWGDKGYYLMKYSGIIKYFESLNSESIKAKTKTFNLNNTLNEMNQPRLLDINQIIRNEFI